MEKKDMTITTEWNIQHGIMEQKDMTITTEKKSKLKQMQKLS